MRIDSNGNVGIGTTAPDQKLTVAGNISQTGVLISSGTGFNYFAGNVGIGTTAPGAKFEVVGGSSTFRGSDSNSAIAGFTDASGNYRVVISTSGNIGVATTNPVEKLDVNGGVKIGNTSIVNAGTMRWTGTAFEGYNGASWVALNGSYTVDSTTTSWAKGINDTIYAMTTSSNVAIGFTDSGGVNKLRVRGGTSDITQNALLAENSSATGLFVVRNDGNVGVGTAVPGAKLDVIGTVKATSFTGDGSAMSGIAGLSAINTFTSSQTITTSSGIWSAANTFAANVVISSAAAARGGGVYVSSNVYIVGFSSAAKYYGDGAGLTGISGDGLGNHIATTTLNMAGYAVANVSTIGFTGSDGGIVLAPYLDKTLNYATGLGIAIGSNTYGNYNFGVGIGNSANSNRDNGVGVGDHAYNNYSGGVGVGASAMNNYSNGVGVGANAYSNADSGVGIGNSASGNSNYAVGIGAYSKDNQTYGSALGAYSYAASSSVALGSYAKANAKESIAIGAGTVNNSTGTASFGVYGINTSSNITAVKFYGDGAGLTNISVTDGTKVAKTGDTMTGNLILTNGIGGSMITAGLTLGATIVINVDSGKGGITTQNVNHRVWFGPGGGETLSITSGKVGVNNSIPDYALDVAGAARASGQAIIGGTLTVTGSAFSVGEAILAVTNGSVGVGTVSPAAKFVVNNGSISVTGLNANLMVAGNVGFGTTPAYPVDIYNASGDIMRFRSSAAYGLIYFNQDAALKGNLGYVNGLGTMFINGEISGAMGLTGAAALQLGAGSNMIITLVGDKAGVGTKNPLYALDVSTVNLTDQYVFRAGSDGIAISTGGAIQTTGFGYGTVKGNARGNGAVDLQTSRLAVSQVASGNYSVIAGGLNNTANTYGCVVGGGQSNSCIGNSYGTVSGGMGNSAENTYATVGGGGSNQAKAVYSFVGGGSQNIASGDASVISGGANNNASGFYSVVPGGSGNIASGKFSFAAGYKSSSTLDGTFTWADSEGVPLINSIMDQAMFKARGGFWVSTGTLYSSPGLFVDSQNRVGIGTASPFFKLHVTADTGGAIAGLSNSASSTDAAVYGWANSGATAVKGVSAAGYAGRFEGSVYIAGASGTGLGKLSVHGTGPGHALYISTDSLGVTGNLVVNNAGNVGIGTTGPGATLDVNGTVKLSRYLVESRDAGGILTTADFGKTITVNNGLAQTLSLPAVAGTDIGAQFTIVKLGAGKVTITAGATAYIADSAIAGSIYNNAVTPAYATITLRLVTATQWMIVGGEGSWITQ